MSTPRGWEFATGPAPIRAGFLSTGGRDPAQQPKWPGSRPERAGTEVGPALSAGTGKAPHFVMTESCSGFGRGVAPGAPVDALPTSAGAVAAGRNGPEGTGPAPADAGNGWRRAAAR